MRSSSGVHHPTGPRSPRITSQQIDATEVWVPKHFGHSNVRKSKPGLSGSMSRNAIISPHFGQRGLLITFANTCVFPIGSCTIGRALRKSRVLNVTNVWKSTGRLRSNHETIFLENQICTMLPASQLNRLPKLSDHTVTSGRPSLCDPNLQSQFLSLRRSSAPRSLRLLKTNPRPARPMKEPSVQALPPARKRKRVRPQGRPRAAGPTKAARRIHRLRTTLLPGRIPRLLRKAVADIDIVFGGGCTLREHGPRSNPGPLLFYGCEFASSEQPPGLPPLRMHPRTRESHP